jgi:hypothetical protein
MKMGIPLNWPPNCRRQCSVLASERVLKELRGMGTGSANLLSAVRLLDVHKPNWGKATIYNCTLAISFSAQGTQDQATFKRITYVGEKAI